MTESIIKQYKILEKLGAGNYAEVFKAENLETKETVAIKKMKKMTKAVHIYIYSGQRNGHERDKYYEKFEAQEYCLV